MKELESWESMQMTSTDVESKREVEWTEELVSTKIGELTANLIRISRGSGKLYEVEKQVMDLAELFAKHRSITSHGVSPHIFAEALSFEPEISNEDRELADFQRVRTQIVKGALQLAASEILGQNTFKHSGETELLEGQRHWEELRKTRNVSR